MTIGLLRVILFHFHAYCRVKFLSTFIQQPKMRIAALTIQFLKRELRNRFAGSFSGGLWALFQPLFQLAVYTFVFVHVFKAKLPGADAPGYVPFLVVALWPWTMFSEAIQRATTTIQDNAALIGKVAIPRELLVLVAVSSSFLIHIVGFVAVIFILWLTSTAISLAWAPAALMLYLPLFALTFGFALICAALQVFVRDLVQALAQLLTLIMFSAPIFYERTMLPAPYQDWLSVNPFTFYAEAFRSLLLGHGTVTGTALAVALIGAIVTLAVGHWVFRRLDSHFEDFL